MRDLDDLVARVGRKARAQRQLPAVVEPGRLREAEQALGFPLPPLLAALYLRVSDGGFGPGGDVPIPGYNAALLHPLDRLVETYRDNHESHPDIPYAPWPEGVLPFLYWGCFAEAAVDCLSPTYTVLMYESDVEEVAPERAWKIQAPSLTAWWEAWLADALPEPTEVWHR